MIKELAIIGHPSKLGGADTELDHQIHVWQKMGVKVHICHTAPLDANLKNMRMDLRGCVIHNPRDWRSIKGMHTISFCNGRFLQYLPMIKNYAKSTTFVNCMTWNFKKEIDCQRKGLIDFHLYQSDHGLQMVSKKLRRLGKPYRPIRFQPYFHLADFPYYKDRSTNKFRFGRISRGDADKYHEKQMWIYQQFNSPVPKKGIILGYDQRAQKKFGNQLDRCKFIKAYPEGGISQQDFYKSTDVMILMSKTFENMPRIGFEAMASGTVLVVDNRGGWKVQVESGKTGFLCDTERDFVRNSSLLANNPEICQTMREEARKKLERDWGMKSSIKSWENVFKQWESLGK